MQRIVFLLLAMLVVAGCGGTPEEREQIDLLGSASHFSSGSRERVPHLALLRDPTDHRITSNCAWGASSKELERLGIADLQARLDRLVVGRVVRIVDGTCKTAFPVFVGENRTALAEVANASAAKLVPLVESISERLAPALGDRQDMLFHVLWSRVIDAVWGLAWQRASLGGDLPAVVWVVKPEHAYMVGTNYHSLPGRGSLALTWSPRFLDHLSYFEGKNFDLAKLAWGEELTDPATVEGLTGYGVFDVDGSNRLFSFPQGGDIDLLCERLANEYAAAVANVQDWHRLSRRFDFHPGDLFVVVVHEIAYAVFEDLHRKGKLDVPSVLLDGTTRAQVVRLASVGKGDPPGPIDEAMAVYMRNGWHGSPEAVALFRETLASTPDDVDGLWFLALSLFDIEEYDDAIETFERVVALTGGNPDELLKHDWSRIWIGHVHDVRGDRDRAVARYEEVIRSSHESGQLQMGQYNIGPVQAKNWARQRIQTPYSRAK
jgi:tetratricopeptide (TPR) repeat protein